MSKDLPKPSAAPCGTCPYRRDVPAGIWAEHEYEKLPTYDGEIIDQLNAGAGGLFFCHQNDGHLCAGWVGCHDMDNTLATRLHHVDPSTFSYDSPVPLFNSGKEACEHGLSGIDDPDGDAIVGNREAYGEGGGAVTVRDPNDGLYLVWSEEHGAWWRPARRGYTTSIKEAGRYTEGGAQTIVRHANYGGKFHEIAIPCPKGIPS